MEKNDITKKRRKNRAKNQSQVKSLSPRKKRDEMRKERKVRRE